MNFTTSKRLFDLLVAPLVSFLPKLVSGHNADYRTHKFSGFHHVLLTVFAQLTHTESANALITELNDTTLAGRERNLRQLIGFDFWDVDRPVSLNQSSFSRANQQRNYRLWQQSFHRLYRRLRPQLDGVPELIGLGKLVAVDGTLLACLGRMTWAVYRQTKNKLKGHFFFDLAGLPERLVLTTGKGSERKTLNEWVRDGVTYLLDRGYNDYTLFAEIGVRGGFFVTRLYTNALYRVLESLPIAESARKLGVEQDDVIELKTAQAHLRLRRVVYRDASGQQYEYLTNRFDLSALDVARLYLYRWEIENFFKWIKRHLNIGHWYSECENGVLIQLYAALIAFLLLKFYTLKGKLAQARHASLGRDFLWWLVLHLFEPVTDEELNAYLIATGFNGAPDSS